MRTIVETMTRYLYPLLLSSALILTACSKEDAESAAPDAAAQPAAVQQPAPEPVEEAQPVRPATPAANPQPAAASGDATPLGSYPLPDLDPKPTYQPRPVYPQAMRETMTEGEVQISFNVTAEGGVDGIEVRTATDSAFAENLVQAVQQWRFQPARANGVPVPRRVQLVVPFYINNRVMERQDEVLQRTETQPFLRAFTRPANPDNKVGKVVARISIGATSIVEKVEIVENEAGVDPEALRRPLRSWLFLPFLKDGNYVASEVLVGFNYAPGGSVLIQYPYPREAAVSSK